MIARHDYPKTRRILARWPLRELLLAVRAHARRDALRQWRFEVAVWAALAPHQQRPKPAPAVPALLASPVR